MIRNRWRRRPESVIVTTIVFGGIGKTKFYADLSLSLNRFVYLYACDLSHLDFGDAALRVCALCAKGVLDAESPTALVTVAIVPATQAASLRAGELALSRSVIDHRYSQRCARDLVPLNARKHNRPHGRM